MKALSAIVIAAALSSMAGGQTVNAITSGGLGYAVPMPVNSLTPVAGFRSQSALNSRHMALALEKDFITMHAVGTSIRGTNIVAYRFATAGTTTPDGTAKGAAMLQGTIHPREWISPEVVTAVFERLAAGEDATARFLVDNLEIVILPIANPDGFAVTQLFPAQTVGGSASGGGGADGRMRRKSMLNADDFLSTTGDAFNGVDLNRNHSFGFGGGSGSTTGETYRGPSAGSEPESQALYAAAALLNESRLRFYVDVHSHQQVYYSITDASAARSAAVIDAYGIMRSVTIGISGRIYGNLPTRVETESIGATDEYFAGTYRAMSYTLEARPPSGELFNGFILPDSQVDATRRELEPAIAAGLYYSAGPASVREVLIYDTTDGRSESSPLVFRQARTTQVGGATRILVTIANGPLRTTRRYTAVIRFTKPMRERDTGSGILRAFPGVSTTAAPGISLANVANGAVPVFVVDGGGSIFGWDRYGGDTAVADFDLRQSVVPNGVYTLELSGTDLAGTALDADPRTVADWSVTGWTGWDAGGVDALTGVPILNDTTNVGDAWLLLGSALPPR